MSNTDDVIKRIIEGAARERDQSYEAAVNALSEKDQRIVATHMGFVVLHIRLCRIAELMQRHGLDARIERDGGRITLHSQMRSAACICTLKDDSIEIQRLGRMPRPDAIVDFFEKWSPPPGGKFDAPTLMVSLDAVAVHIATHLAGG